jgi:hypothetical protein
MVRPFLWSCAKAVGSDALCTSGNIMTDIAANKSPDVKARDIVSKRLGESVHNIVRKMRGGRGNRWRDGAPSKTT